MKLGKSQNYNKTMSRQEKRQRAEGYFQETKKTYVNFPYEKELRKLSTLPPYTLPH